MQGALGEAGEGAKSQMAKSFVCCAEGVGLHTVPNVTNQGLQMDFSTLSTL